jgi:hypothetical protein
MMGVTDPQRSAGAALFVQFFVCALLTSWGMAMILSHAGPMEVGRAIGFGILVWLGFAGATSYATARAARSQSRFGRSRLDTTSSRSSSRRSFFPPGGSLALR